MRRSIVGIAHERYGAIVSPELQLPGGGDAGSDPYGEDARPLVASSELQTVADEERQQPTGGRAGEVHGSAGVTSSVPTRERRGQWRRACI